MIEAEQEAVEVVVVVSRQQLVSVEQLELLLEVEA